MSKKSEQYKEMRQIEMMLDESYDCVWFFIYDAASTNMKRIIGVNFHHGTSDIDVAYAVPCERMTKLYFEHARNLGDNWNRLECIREARNEYVAQNYKQERQETIAKIVSSQFEIIYEKAMDKCFCKAGDESPMQAIEKSRIEGELTSLINEFITNNL